MAAAIEAAITACGGGGGGGGSGSNSNPSAAAGANSNPSSGTGDGTTITPPTVPPATPSATGYWSDPTTWAGPGVPANYIPGPSDNVYITSAQTVYLDGSATCATLTIFGTLRSLPTPTRNISLTTGNINIMGSGTLQIGTEAAPFPAAFTATIELNGAEVGRVSRTVQGTSLGFTNNGEGRSIRVEAGGTLSLIGTAPTIKRTKLNAHAPAGATSFTLADTTGWKAGNEIVIGTTDFYGVSTPEKLTLASNAAGTTVTTTTPIAAKRWGLLQYVTDSGMSLTPGTLTGAHVNTPSVLDERAFVINLTRNIVVQGANDTAWTSRKFGAHCMFMGRNSSIKLDGVQFRRVGQAGALGRYPIHWHMMSYNMPSGMNAVSDGTFLGAAVGGHYAKNCSVSESGQRMITIHGTHGITLDSNVGFDITGHGIFLEDGSEMDNVITNNVVMKLRAPISSNKLLMHDSASAAIPLGVNTTIGSACYWNTNPRNTWIGNWANDSEGAGFWSSFATQCFGLSTNVGLAPINIPLTQIDNTVSIGNKGAGQLTNDKVINDRGDTDQLRYEATFFSNPIKNLNLFKNSGGGYSNRVFEAQYQTFICADNAGMDVFGQSTSDISVMKNTLSISESLNNTTSKRLSSYRAAFATYHELLNFKDCTAVGYTYIAGAQEYSNSTFTGGGLFRLWDLYLQPFFSFSENTNLKLINCNAPFRTLPPFKDGQPDNNRHWAVAGVIFDKNGVFGVQGKYWVLNDPFFTYTANNPANISSGIPSNGVVTTDPYYGVTAIKHTDDLSLYTFQLPLNVSRQDSSGTEVGNWNVPDGATSWQFSNMRSFAPHKGGRYVVSIPGHAPGNYFEFTVMHQKQVGDRFLLAVPFSGALNPVIYQQASGSARFADNRANLSTSSTTLAVSGGYGRYLVSDTFSNVINDVSGTKYYKDTANNLIWMQVSTEALSTAGLAAGIYGTDAFTIEYRTVMVAISV